MAYFNKLAAFVFGLFLLSTNLVYAQQDTTETIDIPIFKNVVSDDEEGDDIKSEEFLNKKSKKNKNDSQIVFDDQLDDDGEKLRYMEQLYHAGKYSDALNVVNRLKNSKLTNDELCYYLKYEIACFKELDYQSEADSAAKYFKKRFPFYKTAKYDPLPFRDLLENFYSRPLFGVWAKVGPTKPDIAIDTVHQVLDSVVVEPKYETKIKTAVEIGFVYYPLSFLGVSIGLKYKELEYTRRLPYTFDNYTVYSLNYNENNKIFAVPVCLFFTMPSESQWHGEFYLGAQVESVVNSSYSVYNLTEMGIQTQFNVVNGDTDLKSKTEYNIAALGGLRLNYTYKRMMFFVDLSYVRALNCFNNPNYNYSDYNLFFNKQFVSDAFTVSNFNLSFGIRCNFKYVTIAKYNYGY